MNEIKTTSRKEATRQALLAAARQIFADKGFDAARTSDIAKAAGCAEGTLFSHFGSKTDLLAWFLRDISEKLRHEAEAIMRHERDPAIALDKMALHYLDYLEENWDICRVFGIYGRYDQGPFGEEFRNRNRVYTGLYLQCLQDMQQMDLLRKDIDLTIIRDSFFGAAEHYLIARHQKGGAIAQRPENRVFLHQFTRMAMTGARINTQQQILPTKPAPGQLDRLEQKIDRLLAKGE